MQETRVRSLGQENPLEKWLASHSSILAWRIPWTEKPVRLQSLGLQRVGRNWATNMRVRAHTHTHRVFQVFYLFLGEFVNFSRNASIYLYYQVYRHKVAYRSLFSFHCDNYPFILYDGRFVFSHFFLDQGKLWIDFFLMFYYKKGWVCAFFPYCLLSISLVSVIYLSFCLLWV